MLKITKAQLDKHNELNTKFNDNVTFPDGYELVEYANAQKIGATYGHMYICILPDGSSHS